MLLAAGTMLWALSGGQLLADDFEGGVVVGPASWSSLQQVPGAPPLTVETLAAHRGDAGLTFTLMPDGGTASSYGAWLQLDLPDISTGTLSLRYWVRERTSNQLSAVIFSQFWMTNPLHPVAVEVGPNHGDDAWHLQGFDASDAGQSVLLGTPMTVPDWHLVEMELDNLGTDAGFRRLIVDGQLVVHADNQQLTAPIDQAHLGAVYLFPDLAATVDMDDARLDTAPQATTLWGLVAPAVTAACTPVAVTAFDWTTVPRPVPYAFTAALSSSPGLSLHALSDCSDPPVSAVPFAAGSMGQAVYARASVPGLHWVRASHVDFLTRQLNVPVTGDAGVSLSLGPQQTVPQAHPADDGALLALAFDGTQFLLTWDDFGTGVISVDGARIGRDGGLLDTFLVSSGMSAAQWPSAVFDGADFIVTWSDGRAGAFDIYGARVSPAGVVRDPQGQPISTDPAGFKFVPQVRCETSGGCLAVWSDRTASPSWVLNARHVDTALATLESADLPLFATATSRYLPRMIADGPPFVAWSDQTPAGTYRVAYSRLGIDGAPLDGDGGTVSGIIGATQARPAVTWDGTSWWLAWDDASQGSPFIGLARVAADGGLLPSPPGPYVTAGVPSQPDLAWDGVAVWLAYDVDVLDGGFIGGMRYGVSGLPLESPLALSAQAAWVRRPTLLGDGQGHALLAWAAAGADGGAELHERMLLEVAENVPGPDAAVPDAGSLAPRIETVACGCASAADPLAALLALLCVMRRRNFGGGVGKIQ
jgi:hypothetical protein